MNYLLFFLCVMFLMILVLTVTLVQVFNKNKGSGDFDNITVRGNTSTNTLESNVSHLAEVFSDTTTTQNLTVTNGTIDTLSTTTLSATNINLAQMITGGNSRFFLTETETLDAGNIVLDGNNPSVIDASGSNTSITFPKGTTAQRPSTPQQGMTRFNTTTGQFEGYDGSQWSTIMGSFDPTITNPQPGQLIYYNGTEWVNGLYIEKPTVTSFTNNTASASAYSTYLKLDFSQSQWQLYNMSGALFFDSGIIGAQTSYDFTDHVAGDQEVQYQIRVRYGGPSAYDSFSEWSDLFTGTSVLWIQTPDITSIHENIATSDAFSSYISGVTLDYSQWQLFNIGGSTPIFDSGTSAGAVTSYNFTPEVTAGNSYEARVRYVSNSSIYGASQWSSKVTFTASTIIFNPPSGSSLTSAEYNVPYSQTITVSGGTPPYTITVNAPNGLPPGLSYSISSSLNTVTISGTPTSNISADEDYPITVNVTDSSSVQGIGSYDLKQVYLLQVSLPGFLPPKYGTAYSQLVTVSGGTSPYTDAGSILPTDLSFNVSTMEITGTMSVTGSQNIQIKLQDSSGHTGSSPLEPFIVPAVLEISDPVINSFLPSSSSNIKAIPDASMNLTPLSFTAGTYITTSGAYNHRVYPIIMGGTTTITLQSSGIGNLSGSITSGTLPTGLSIQSPQSSQVVISGVTTEQGFSDITLQVEDSNGIIGVIIFAIVVCYVEDPAPVFTYTPSGVSFKTATIANANSVTDNTFSYPFTTTVGDGTVRFIIAYQSFNGVYWKAIYNKSGTETTNSFNLSWIVPSGETCFVRLFMIDSSFSAIYMENTISVTHS